MEVYRGTNRTAFVGSKYTAKVARSNPKQFVRYAQSVKERAGFNTVIKSWNAHSANTHQSLKNLLLHGVVANRRERRLAKQNESVVIPTICLLGGLVNIQPTASSTGLEHEAVHSAFVETLGPRITSLGHMLEDINNIGVIDGQVKFVDGGDRGLEKLMQTHPVSIQQALGSLAAQLNR